MTDYDEEHNCMDSEIIEIRAINAELLEACREAEKAIGPMAIEAWRARQILRAAIAKATGGSDG